MLLLFGAGDEGVAGVRLRGTAIRTARAGGAVANASRFGFAPPDTDANSPGVIGPFYVHEVQGYEIGQAVVITVTYRKVIG